MSIRRKTCAVFVAAAVFAALFAPEAKGARLDVADLMVFYDTAGPTSAEGRIEFNLRYGALGLQTGTGPIPSYDLFVAQIMISKALMGDSAVFTLDTLATQDTAGIGSDYWIPSVPTGFEVASTHGDEFRFRDRTSTGSPVTPSTADILAHFVIDFQVNSPDEFGEYTVHGGDGSANFFGSLIVNTFPNAINSFNFFLIPEPASGSLLLAAGVLVLARRRRRG